MVESDNKRKAGSAEDDRHLAKRMKIEDDEESDDYDEDDEELEVKDEEDEDAVESDVAGGVVEEDDEEEQEQEQEPVQIRETKKKKYLTKKKRQKEKKPKPKKKNKRKEHEEEEEEEEAQQQGSDKDDEDDEEDDEEADATDVKDEDGDDAKDENGNTENGDANESHVTTFVFDDVEYKYKERPAVIEEREGKIEFRVVNNDNARESMMILTGLKNIFQKQLPKMPREYIARLVYDRSHVSIAVVRKPHLQVVGGITYRPFESRKFAEIVFCAISSTEQVRGYGAHLMNHLKDYVKGTTPIMYFLTYADNYAIGYFKKQGFTKEISLDKSVWMGYIKDYEGGTIMQCSMLPRIRYLDASKILLLQKAAIMAKIREFSKSHIIRPGIQAFKNGVTKIDPMTIPGLKEAGWTPEMDELARRPKRGPHFAVMQHLLSEMENHASAWPFVIPVNRDEVPDYYEVIKEPMDLSTMEARLEADSYESMEDFIYDARLIFNNCRQYNNETTTYYKHATKLEKFLYSKVREIPEYSHLVE